MPRIASRTLLDRLSGAVVTGVVGEAGARAHRVIVIHVDERLVAADAEDVGAVQGCYAATRIGALPVSPQKPYAPGDKLLLAGAPSIVGLPFQLPGAVALPP
jgi:hypothetical protein